jgi:hypothetical protein
MGLAVGFYGSWRFEDADRRGEGEDVVARGVVVNMKKG